MQIALDTSMRIILILWTSFLLVLNTRTMCLYSVARHRNRLLKTSPLVLYCSVFVFLRMWDPTGWNGLYSPGVISFVSYTAAACLITIALLYNLYQMEVVSKMLRTRHNKRLKDRMEQLRFSMNGALRLVIIFFVLMQIAACLIPVFYQLMAGGLYVKSVDLAVYIFFLILELLMFGNLLLVSGGLLKDLREAYREATKKDSLDASSTATEPIPPPPAVDSTARCARIFTLCQCGKEVSTGRRDNLHETIDSLVRFRQLSFLFNILCTLMFVFLILSTWAGEDVYDVPDNPGIVDYMGSFVTVLAQCLVTYGFWQRNTGDMEDTSTDIASNSSHTHSSMGRISVQLAYSQPPTPCHSSSPRHSDTKRATLTQSASPSDSHRLDPSPSSSPSISVRTPTPSVTLRETLR
eukprot:g13635.t1